MVTCSMHVAATLLTAIVLSVWLIVVALWDRPTETRNVRVAEHRCADGWRGSGQVQATLSVELIYRA